MGQSGKARARASAKARRVANNRKLNQKALLRKTIRKWDDPILKEVCAPVEKFDNELQQLVANMIKVLSATKDGVGLAAPQLGVAKRVLVYRTSLNSKDYKVIVNPILVDKSFETVKSHEGCLSFPGFTAIVERYSKVQIKYKTETGEDKTEWLEGRASVIFQHEADHLEGICAVGLVWKQKMGLGLDANIVDEDDFGYDEAEEAYDEHTAIGQSDYEHVELENAGSDK